MLLPVRTVAPTATPVTTTQLKTHLNVAADDMAQDAYIASLGAAAVSYVDGHAGVLGRALVTQTWTQAFPGFSICLRLPVGDVIAISSIKYYDADGVLQTVASTVYTVLTDRRGPFVTPATGQYWPSPAGGRPDAVEVTWTAGFGPAGTDVPAAIRQALMLLVGHWYENRESVVAGTIAQNVPISSVALLAPFRKTGV